MKPVYNTNSSTFGRNYFLEEVTSEQIAEANQVINSKGHQKLLDKRARIEDIKMATELGITVEELNQNRAV